MADDDGKALKAFLYALLIALFGAAALMAIVSGVRLFASGRMAIEGPR